MFNVILKTIFVISLKNLYMSEFEKVLTAIGELKTAISELRSDTISGFKSNNKRLDGIENELRKIDTVLGYSDQYNNIPT